MIYPIGAHHAAVAAKCIQPQKYYMLAFIVGFIIFLPIFKARVENAAIGSYVLSQGSLAWFVISCVIAIPLMFEFSLDSMVSVIYSKQYHKLVEHRAGHASFIVALVLPAVGVLCSIDSDSTTPKISLLLGFCFILFGQYVAAVGMLGMLHNFDPNIWIVSRVVSPALFMMLVTQINFSFSVMSCTDTTMDSQDTHEEDCIGDYQLGCCVATSLLCLVIVMIASRSYFFEALSWRRDKPSNTHKSSVDAHHYACLIVASILALLIASQTVVLLLYMKSDLSLNTLLQIETAVHIGLVTTAAVLPGRMVRKDVVSLKHEMESKKTFIQYISHEIRSPLSTTSLGLDYLIEQISARKMQSLEEVLEIVKDAKMTCELATNTLNDLLMFDKIESGMLEIVTAECNAWEFVNNCVRPFHLQAATANISLYCGRVDSDGHARYDLEAARALTSILVDMDKFKMDQVLRNFVSNAIKFVPQNCNGSISVNVSTQDDFTVDQQGSSRNHARRDSLGTAAISPRRRLSDYSLPAGGRVQTSPTNQNTVLRVEVVDNGPGISQENLPKLFGQYVQFDANTLQGGKGSGLGLWLSKAIVEMHGGVIGASCQGVGQGCTFYFELPCRVVDVALSPPVLASRSDDLPSVSTVAINNLYSGHLQRSCSDTLHSSGDYSAQITAHRGLFHNVMLPPIDTAPLLHHLSSVHSLVDPSDKLMPLEAVRAKRSPQSPPNGSDRKSVSSGIAGIVGVVRRVTPTSVHSRERQSMRRHSEGGASQHSSSSNNNSVRFSHRSSDVEEPSSYFSVAHSVDSEYDCRISDLRVLLVDDSAIARKMVERTLTAVDSLCDHARDGREAVTKVRQSQQRGERPYDVIMMDCYMPVMNGPEAVVAIRGPECEFRGIILAVTGAASSNSEFTALLGQGVDRILVKPFNLDAFRRVISELMSSRATDKNKVR